MSPIELFWTAKNLNADKNKKDKKTDVFLSRGILLTKKSRFSVPKWNFLRHSWFPDGLEPARTTLWAFFCRLSPQARGTSVMSSLFHSVLKGIYGISRRSWGCQDYFFIFISIDQGYIIEVFNVWKSSQRNVWYSVQLEGKVWYLTQLCSQARDTSIDSFLFQSVCNFSSP